MDQAVHYIPQQASNHTASGGDKMKRRVTMNKDLNVQAQIILVGDDGEQQVGEAYEEWEESMVTECSDDDDDDDEDDDFESMDEKEQEQDDIGVNPDSLQHRASHQESTTAAASSLSVSQQQPASSVPDSNTTASSNSSTSSTNTPPNHASINTKQPTPVGSLWRLFSRGKRITISSPALLFPLVYHRKMPIVDLCLHLLLQSCPKIEQLLVTVMQQPATTTTINLLSSVYLQAMSM